MTRWRILLARLADLGRGRRLDREAGEEIQHHLDALTDEYVRRGFGRDDARRLAQRDFGGDFRAHEQMRDQHGFPSVEALMQDIRYAVRLLLKNRGFAVVAISTLALGIGVNAAIFSVVDAVMLRPLPYPDPGRLVSIWEATVRQGPAVSNTRGTSIGGAISAGRMVVAPANLVDYRRDTRAFTLMAGFTQVGKNLTGTGSPERLQGEEVTHEYLEVLGATPALGRPILASDDQPGASRVVLLSDGLWRRRFAADPNVVGRRITLDDDTYDVIGVMGPAFEPVSQFTSIEPIVFWVPAAYPADLLASRGDHEINVVARLKQDATLDAARAELKAVTVRLGAESPQTSTSMIADLQPLREDLIRNVRTSLVVLLLAVGLILLIACVNVANLLLIRAVGRRHEIAVRVALGASRGRITRELMTQGAVLAILGGAAGLALGVWTQGVLVHMAPAGIPRIQTVGLNAALVLFTAAAAAVTVVVFGLFPAWQAGRARPIEAMKGRSRLVADAGVLRWRGALMIVDIALSTILLVGASLMLRSLGRLNGVELGFATDHVLTMNVQLPETRYKTADDRFAFYDNLAERVARQPGVVSVAFANRMPMRGGWSSGLQLDGGPELDRSTDADFQAVSPGYFRTLGIPLLAGRLLASTDRKGSEPAAVVSEAFSRTFLKGAPGIGRRFRRGSQMPWINVVGVVADVRRGGRAAPLNPEVYLSAAQTTVYPVRLADFAVRAAGNPLLLTPVVQAEVVAIDKDLPVTNVRTLDEILSIRSADQRFQATLFVLFAGLALTLAVVGIYGVVAYAVAQRVPEIGVRMALGASRARILGWIVGQAAWLVAVGMVGGLAAATALSRYVATLLFEIGPSDVASYALAAVVLGAVAIAASGLAGRAATRVDPIIALRQE